MALRYSPKITTDGLVMCLDASQNKSYPTDLPVKNGLALWLDAADDTTFSYSSGTSVSQWRDKSGNNRHFFQATAGNQPSRSAVINSRKAIQFTAASSQYLRYNSTIINNTTGGSVFVVWRTAGETNAYSSILDNYHCGANALGAGFQIERNVTNNQYYWGFQSTGCSNAGRNISFPVSYSDNITYIYSISKDSSNVTAFSNGTSVTLESSPSATWVEDTKGWTIGCWGNGAETFGRFYNGQHCEVIIFNRGLSPIEVKQVNTYLGQKWGISNTDRSIVDLAGNDDNGLFGNGTVANMPLYDYYNKGTLKFDGSNDYVSVGANAILRGNSISLGVFFKTINNGQSVQFIAGYGDTGVQGYWLGVVGGPIRFFVGNGSTSLQLNSGISPNNDQIYYVVGTYDGTNQRIYVDGVLMASSTSVNGSLSYTGMTDGFLIGQVQGFTGGRYLTGNIYAMQVYNKALSAAEVLQNYEAQKSKFANTIVQQGLVLNLDAGNPYSYAGAGTTWYDVSGNTKDFIIDGSGITYNSGGYFTLADGGITRSATITNSTTCTVVVWIRTTDTQALTFKGNNSGSFYLAAYYVGSGFYSDNCGSPTYWIDTVSVSNPNPTYLDGNWHMWEMKNVNFSSWTTYEFNRYGGFTFGNGAVGQIMIYDRNLSSGESLQIYNATKGRFGL
jgi:hypothetical protein